MRQPAKITDAGDALRLGEMLLAEHQILERRVSAQHVADPVRQHRPVDGLADEIGGADAIGSIDRVDIVERCRHQNRCFGPARQRPHRRTHIEAIHVRHHHVEHNDVRPEAGETLQRLATARRLDDVEAGGFEHLTLQEPLDLVVVGDQDQRAVPLKPIEHQATRGRRAVNAAFASW